MSSLNLKVLLGLLVAGMCALVFFVMNEDGGRGADAYQVFGAESDSAAGLDQERIGNGGNADGVRGDSEARIAVARDPLGAEEETLTLADLSLRGRVVSPAGSPVAGVKVLAESSVSWLKLPLGAESISGINDWRSSNEAITNDEGVFRFDELDGGTYAIEAHDKQHRPSRMDDVRYFKEQGIDVGDLMLKPGGLVRGQVVDDSGRGVAGAQLLESFGHPRDRSQAKIPGRGRVVGESDESGRFRLANLTPGPLHLIVDSVEHQPTEVEATAVLAGEPEEELVVHLEIGFPLEGRVEGLTPERLAEVRVTARLRNASSDVGNTGPRTAVSKRPRTVRCKADGSFRIGGLAPQQDYRLTAFEIADDETGKLVRLPAIDPVYARPGDIDVVLGLKKPTGLHFRVVDDATGEPVTSFEVRAGFENVRALQERGETKREHPGGLVQFSNLDGEADAEFARLEIRAAAYEAFEQGDIALKEEEDVDLGELRLIPAAKLLVTVTDKLTGRAVLDAYVFAGGLESRKGLVARSASSDLADPVFADGLSGAPVGEQGVAALELISNEPSLVFVSARGYAAYESSEQNFSGTEDVQFAVSLVRGGDVRVQVRDQLGAAGVDVLVLHRHFDEDQTEPQWLAVKQEWRTNEEGEVVFKELQAGDHGFRLLSEAENDLDAYISTSKQDAWTEVTVGNGSSSEIELTYQSRSSLSGLVLQGREPLAGADLTLVTLENGEPVRQRNRGMWFGASRDDPTRTRSDEEGAYQFSNVKAGDYLIRLSHADRYMTDEVRVTVQPDPTEFDLRLDAASIEGRVTDIAGTPLIGVRIQANTDDGAREYRNNQGGLEIGEDEEGEMTIGMTEQSPEEAGIRRSGIVTDSAGRYVIRGVRTGEKVTVSVGERYYVRSSVKVKALGRDEVRRGVDFVLEGAGAVKLKVTKMPEGVDRLRVALEYLEEGDRQGKTRRRWVRGWNRSATLSSLFPGRWKLEVQLRDGTVLQTFEPVVVVGQTTEQSIEFP